MGPPTLHRYEHFFSLLLLFLFYTLGWWTQFVLDANAHSVGKSFCDTFNNASRDPLGLSVRFTNPSVDDVACKMGIFVGMVFLDLFLFFCALLIMCVLYR